VLAVGVAVKGAASGDRDVLFLDSVNERRNIHQFNAFEPGKHHGVSGGVTQEADRPTLCQVEADITLQADRASQKLAFGHENTTTSRLAACGDCVFKSPCAIEAVVSQSSELGDIEFAIGEVWRFYALENSRNFRPRI
jgi:hypothetical protein